jgi:hypothetical protein
MSDNTTKNTVVGKLLSDRLWALLLLVGVVIGNRKLDFGLTEGDVEDLFWAVMAFIGGKSIRGTESAGKMATFLGLIGTAEKPGAAAPAPAARPPRPPPGDGGSLLPITLLFLSTAVLLGGTGCGAGRSQMAATMTSHITFLSARVEAANPLLLQAAQEANAAGDTAACETYAEEYLVNTHRVPWHEAFAAWLLEQDGAEDPGNPPKIPGVETICSPALLPMRLEEAPVLSGGPQ